MENKKENSISLGDIYRVIKKNIILIVIITLAITFVGGAYAFTRTPVYSANAKVLIAANEQSTNSSQIDSTDSLRFTQTYADTVKESDSIILDVIYDYNNTPMNFKYDGKDYENTVPATVIKQKLTDSSSSINYISARISTSASVESYRVSITFTDQDPDLAVILVNLLVEASKKEFEYKDNSALGEYADFKIQVMTSKVAKESFYSGINKKLYLIIAFLAGAVIAAVVVFVKEFMSNKFKTKDEITNTVDELPIGLFYDNKDNKNKDIMLVEPTIRNYEPYNRLFTNIKYANLDNPYKVILFTSTIEDELKSFISSNLASCINNNEKKVLLIDLDLRKPTVHKTYNVTRENGIVEYVSGEANLESIIKHTENGVDVITAGKNVLNPISILESEKIKSLMTELKSKYDYILLDSAPLAVCNDSFIISNYADGLVYNVTVNHVRKKLFMEHLTRLKEANINIIGFNITKEKLSNDRDSYYYSYKYYNKEN